MPKPFIKLTIEEFEDLCERYDFTRHIDSIHMHHTWRPNHAQYRGLASIESMGEFHTQEQRWSDIAQHITIAPDGSIWTGRNWNHPPASARGHNGSSISGPFMIELIGDFDEGKDAFKDPQKAAAIRVINTLLKKFKLHPSALRFHNQLTDEKSCPGTALDYDAFLDALAEAREKSGPPAIRSRATSKKDGVSPNVEQALRMLSLPGDIDPGLPEFSADHRHGRDETGALRGASRAHPTVSFEPRAHLVNLRDGRLSTSGALATTTADIAALFEDHLPAALQEAREASRPLKIVFYAHGGLSSEKETLAAAMARIPWWINNGIYPIYFIWETGLMETLGQMIERETRNVWGKITGIFGGKRGSGEFIADHAIDPAVERIARSIGGVAIWGGMKSSARRSSERESGGAWLLASALKRFLKDHAKEKIELHAVGHSAGSIFHAHFMDAVIGLVGGNKPVFQSLHHLAPAIRVDLFKQLVIPNVGKGIGALTCYTMRDALERDDNCFKVYRKSLLYLIRHALEAENGCPIVGLERSIRSDSRLKALFFPELPGPAEVIWSDTSAGPRHSSRSRSHGGFDDDDATMNSVCRRIVGNDSIDEFPTGTRSAPLDFTPNGASDEQIALGILAEHAIQRSGAPVEAPPVSAPTADFPLAQIIARPGSKRHALCIGIDAYPDAGDRLSGCVNDARAWQQALDALGFGTTVLLNEDATYDGIRNTFAKIAAGTRPGDVLVFQYSGHGTQFNDLPGDEDEDDDGKDEALCCHDFRKGSCIIDDEIGAAIDRVPAGVALNFFMDCCHSGTSTRVAANGLGDGLPPGAKGRLIVPDKALYEAHVAFRAGSRQRDLRASRAKSDPYAKAREILFAAALPHQLANEISGSGVFTDTAIRILGEANTGHSNEGFMQRVKQSFPAAFRPHQEPRLYASEASANRNFLSPLDGS